MSWKADSTGRRKPEIVWTRNISDYQQHLKVNRTRRVSVLGIVFILTLLTLYTLTAGSPVRPEMSAYESDWNDISEVYSGVRARGYDTRSTTISPGFVREVDDYDKTVLVVIGTEREYSESEAQAVYDFVDKGGRLILASDNTNGNSLAEMFGYGFTGGRLYDINYVKNPAFVQLPVTPSGDFYFSGLITTNEPSAVDFTGDIGVVCRSTDKSWVDINGDGEMSGEDEGYGSRAVAVTGTEGRGRFVFISDPSIFINDMIFRTDNFNFSMYLFTYLLPSGGTVVFEESSHLKSDVFSNTGQYVYSLIYWASSDYILIILSSLGLLLVIGILYIWADYPPQWSHVYYTGHITRPKVIHSPISEEDWLVLRSTVIEKIATKHGVDPELNNVLPYIRDRDMRRALRSEVIPSYHIVRELILYLGRE